ncbi:hypothetical protein J6590_045085 [Homalodisca vitripennis]|nr:hypothetical protein J6590_045085 [Homalodisca vitripennis]
MDRRKKGADNAAAGRRSSTADYHWSYATSSGMLDYGGRTRANKVTLDRSNKGLTRSMGNTICKLFQEEEAREEWACLRECISRRVPHLFAWFQGQTFVQSCSLFTYSAKKPRQVTEVRPHNHVIITCDVSPELTPHTN